MSSNIHGGPIGIVVESLLVLAEIVPDAASLKRPAARAGVAATARRVKKRRLSLVVGALTLDTVPFAGLRPAMVSGIPSPLVTRPRGRIRVSPSRAGVHPGAERPVFGASTLSGCAIPVLHERESHLTAVGWPIGGQMKYIGAAASARGTSARAASLHICSIVVASSASPIRAASA